MVSSRSMNLASPDVKRRMAAQTRLLWDTSAVGWAVAARTRRRGGVVFGRDRHAMLQAMKAILL